MFAREPVARVPPGKRRSDGAPGGRAKKRRPPKEPLKGVGAKPPTTNREDDNTRGVFLDWRQEAVLRHAYRCGTISGIRSSNVRPLPFSPIACIFHSPLWRYSLAMIWAVCEPCTDRS
jgi:hypothetical protein